MKNRTDSAERRDHADLDDAYEAPSITRLGHVATLTLLGSGGLDELESDGSQA